MPSGQTSMTNTSCRVACVPNALSSSPAALLRCGRAPMICALEPLLNHIRLYWAHAVALEARASQAGQGTDIYHGVGLFWSCKHVAGTWKCVFQTRHHRGAPLCEPGFAHAWHVRACAGVKPAVPDTAELYECSMPAPWMTNARLRQIAREAAFYQQRLQEVSTLERCRTGARTSAPHRTRATTTQAVHSTSCSAKRSHCGGDPAHGGATLQVLGSTREHPAQLTT
jgi:hypothetical protein